MSIQRGGVVAVQVLSPRMTGETGIRKLTEQEKAAYVAAACRSFEMREDDPPVKNADTCRRDGDEWSAEIRSE